MIRNTSLKKIQPRCGWDTKVFNHPVFHTGLLMFNPFGINYFGYADAVFAVLKDKIFQPFFTTKPTGSGTGLGLSLSYDIVKAHGGELKVESKKDDGTEFIIQIPS